MCLKCTGHVKSGAVEGSSLPRVTHIAILVLMFSLVPERCVRRFDHTCVQQACQQALRMVSAWQRMQAAAKHPNRQSLALMSAASLRVLLLSCKSRKSAAHLFGPPMHHNLDLFKT